MRAGLRVPWLSAIEAIGHAARVVGKEARILRP
jgi:hypothetical protein